MLKKSKKNTYVLKEAILSIFISIIIIFSIFGVSYMKGKNSEERINTIYNKVENIGGTIVSVDSIGFFESKPFLVSKGEYSYKFIYDIGKETKTGFYKTGFDDTWIFDYKEK